MGELAASEVARGDAAAGVTVGVIVPTYNRASLLAQSLDSVLKQTRPPDNVVVVNDGSTDETESVLRRYGDRIRYVSQPNTGKSAALNRALGMLDTDYVWVMDDDDVAAIDALERHLKHLAAHPEVDYTYSGVWCFSGDAAPDIERCLLWQRNPIAHDTFFVRALEEFPCNQQTMLVPLACYHAVGPYDEKQTFGQDYEMILRLARRYRAGFVADPTVFLRQHGGDRGPSGERIRAAMRFDAWRPYDRRLFRSLRGSLPLSEYLPRGTSGGQLDPIQRRRALLQRACVMARHGLFEEAIEDLETAVAKASSAITWSDEDQRICGSMLNVEPVILDGQDSFLRRAKRLLRLHAPVLHRAAGKGIGWSGISELRARHYRGAAYTAVRLARWAGPAGLVRMVAKELLPKERTSKPMRKTG
ncbi:MAG: glycosyltransferase family 2 protein [Rhodanobacteraceae bacterium]